MTETREDLIDGGYRLQILFQRRDWELLKIMAGPKL
jgi:hypothetical protein